ncbi:hypothetical protein BDV26DRAFT_291194 [Aspergillus bertholletiae]|uniref:Uncharacterized protein n=1 Tax=Aspergillus bertholletiae TaxID=1226010 RepID=A0A5N7BCV4_9EURO|nr:hypothetical protein BDV26DRAFT_291194 [Aspergillus bertholletiae]
MSVKNLLRVSIESKQFPGSYLRIDGRGFTESSGPGGGIVNVQTRVGTYETLIIVNHPEDNTFSILSAEFPNVYLRMDGRNVKSGEKYPSGTGVVNCQVGSRSYEKFRLVDQEDGSKAIVSVAFPDTYLRMENQKGEGGSGGAGTVNCQSYVGTFEKFIIHVL